MKIQKTLSVLAIASAFASIASAQQHKFEIDAKTFGYRNVASIESVADFETFTGKTNGVTGYIAFNSKTKVGSGKIVVDPKSIDTGIPLRNEHMQSAGWLDTTKYPEIVFEAAKVQAIKGNDYKVTGSFTLHGVTKKITVPVTVRYSAAGPANKAAGFEGDIVRLTTKFNIVLADYGITIPQMAAGKVAKDVTISLSTYAISK